MEDKQNEWHSILNGNNIIGSADNAQVPSSLLPTVLHQLGLSPEQVRPELSFDDAKVRLTSDDWQVRAVAVRALGKLDTAASVALIVSALDDQDGSVRAAAVHVLGNLGKQASFGRLVAALHDADWHVRETAVLALGKQGQRVSHEVLLTALHDTDGSVQEAARLALQWRSTEDRTSASYGQLREQKTMQHNGYDTPLSNSEESRTPFETIPYDALDGSFEGTRNSERSLSGQVQVYAPREFASYEFGEVTSSRGEKIIPPRRGLRKGWWAVVAITAILFFLLGSGMTMWLMPVQMQLIGVHPEPVKIISFESPKYNWIAQNDIANALRLDPQQITTQLQAGKSLTEIAAAQGVSATDLRNIELKAFAQSFDEAVKAGDIDQRQADEGIQQLMDNPQLLDKMTATLFLPGPVPRPAPPGAIPPGGN